MREAPLKAVVCDLPVKQREALISLLADDDKGVSVSYTHLTLPTSDLV